MAKKKPESTDAVTPEKAAEYTVLARRYRPGQFQTLVGQDAVAQSLSNALKSGRVAHAYLFTGARGVGKTSTARILAKCLNCEKGPTVTPCDECSLCKAIAVGEDVDVLEIDGASNNGVDAVRDLRSNVQYRPQRGRYKIYIIDEVHMLSTAAFNALLKTLEEPPAHVKFIFATTEVNKIPITILSRCQRFDFPGISLKQIRQRLKEIVESEGMTSDEEALELIARRAGGSMRDAQSLLDQLLAFGSDRLTVDRVHQLLGTAHEERIAAVANSVLSKDASSALAQIAEAADQGLQLGELLDQLIEYWRDLMVVQAAGIENQTLSVTGANREKLTTHAATLSSETILAGLDILVTAKSRLRSTTHGRIVLEMALVRIARLDNLVAVSQLVQWLSEGGAPTASPGAVQPRAAAVVADPEKKKLTAEPGREVGPVKLTAESLPLVWRQVVDQAGFATKGDLQAAIGQRISGPTSLVMTFPHGYNLPNDARRVQMEQLVAKITGESWTVQSELDATRPAPSVPAAPQESPSQKRRREQEAAMQHPLLAKMKETLGAAVIGMDEGFGQVAAAKKIVPVDIDEDVFVGTMEEE